MKKLYVKLGTGSSTPVEYSDDFSGIELRKYLKDVIFKSRPGVGTLKLKDFKFESSNQRKPLDSSFYSRYQHPDSPLVVSVNNLLNNPIPEEHRDLFRASDAMEELAADLQVSNVLYVRHCYQGIYDEIMNYVRKRSVVQVSSTLACNIFLTGTPGIGKTAFLLYFIHQLMKCKNTIVFGSRTNPNFLHCWDGNGIHSVVPWSDVEKLRKNGDHFFIMDSIDVPTTRGPCLVSTSPRDDVGHQHRKNAAKFYMPPWSWDEILLCYHLIYSKLLDLRVPQLAARFYVLGGVPRLLFDNITERACRLIDVALRTTSWDQLKQVAQVDGEKAGDSVSHRLVHRFNSGTDISEYSDCEIRFASQYVTLKVLQYYATGRRDMLLQYLDETAPLGLTGTLRGNIFETPGHHWFRKGFQKTAKRLLSDGKSELVTLKIDARNLQIIASSFDELVKSPENRNDEEKYFQPLSKTFECIDAWIVMNGETWGVQFTVGAKHRISSAVYWYYKNLNLRHYLTVVYDEQKYNDWKYTGITNSKKHPFKEMRIPPDFELNQYVVRADLQSGTINNLTPVDGYECFIPYPGDELVLAELGIAENS